MSQQDNEKTRIVRRSSGSSATPPPPHQAGGHDPEQTQYVPQQQSPHLAAPDATRIVQHGAGYAASPPPAPPVAEGQTVLVRPSSSRKAAAAAPAEPDFDAQGPVVGWLVVVKGPGRGSSLKLGYGMNSIGRESDNRVCLPFGDELISRRKHAVLTYDPRGRKFYLQHGDSVNLTYVGDAPVLAPMILQGGETIRLGSATELRFVPLCGESFDWEESGQ